MGLHVGYLVHNKLSFLSLAVWKSKSVFSPSTNHQIVPVSKTKKKMYEKVFSSFVKIMWFQIDKKRPIMYDKEVEDRGASFKSNRL